jgi:hemerythrin-like domain-containing protein
MDKEFCYNIQVNQTVTYYHNNTINYDKIVKIIPYIHNFSPYIYYDKNNLCGVLMKLIVELSAKYGYRY